ncbi:hypothetical protein E2C01_001194 [Portunus trituberculatus]|uniref:Uncharacterized protein n=1 Tax=Portunus trituberculatus TaxID=210409 RepID=A0A5B7CJU2_PORTR|nr:hypothetical protein [Portunus trituberculatus]
MLKGIGNDTSLLWVISDTCVGRKKVSQHEPNRRAAFTLRSSTTPRSTSMSTTLQAWEVKNR